MLPSILTGIAIHLLFPLVLAIPTADKLSYRQDDSCNTPDNRACWSSGFDITTDYELSTPEGTTRNFDWTIDEYDNWTGPDGVVKEKVMLINDQFPGPLIYADWGDTISITITNNLQANG
jgi:hypothetical protein